ncbi:hypothetical protein [Embleya sp. NPDC005971]|uniref:hypothetical protein n=1 Tax=unclassified Embleya TaxID=2699296 RepID=UPI0033EA8B7B
MFIKGKKRHVAALTATLALTLGFAGTATEAGAATSALGDACRTVVTSNSAGKVYVCWNWYPNSSGNYNGRFHGTFYDLNPKDGRWVILQARWKGQGWTPVATAANGGNFDRDYTNLRDLNFRACLTGGYCGSPAV